MNCAYHIHNPAVVNCNSCGKPLCPTCDHRIKGFPFCQDCIVSGIDLLRRHNQNHDSHAPFIKKQTSPIIATLLSFICPGLGAAYNGQTTKALIHFTVFVGLFQMAVLTGGMAIFVIGFFGMWVFAALDAFRTAQTIRSGITPDDAEDLLVQRFSGNTKLWGIVLTVLGISFFLQTFLNFRFISKFVIPVLLIGLGVHLLRNFISNPSHKSEKTNNFAVGGDVSNFTDALNETNFRSEDEDFTAKSKVRNWKNG